MLLLPTIWISLSIFDIVKLWQVRLLQYALNFKFKLICRPIAPIAMDQIHCQQSILHKTLSLKLWEHFQARKVDADPRALVSVESIHFLGSLFLPECRLGYLFFFHTNRQITYESKCLCLLPRIQTTEQFTSLQFKVELFQFHTLRHFL